MSLVSVTEKSLEVASESISDSDTPTESKISSVMEPTNDKTLP